MDPSDPGALASVPDRRARRPVQVDGGRRRQRRAHQRQRIGLGCRGIRRQGDDAIQQGRRGREDHAGASVQRSPDPRRRHPRDDRAATRPADPGGRRGREGRPRARHPAGGVRATAGSGHQRAEPARCDDPADGRPDRAPRTIAAERSPRCTTNSPTPHWLRLRATSIPPSSGWPSPTRTSRNGRNLVVASGGSADRTRRRRPGSGVGSAVRHARCWTRWTAQRRTSTARSPPCRRPSPTSRTASRPQAISWRRATLAHDRSSARPATSRSAPSPTRRAPAPPIPLGAFTKLTAGRRRAGPAAGQRRRRTRGGRAAQPRLRPGAVHRAVAGASGVGLHRRAPRQHRSGGAHPARRGGAPAAGGAGQAREPTSTRRSHTRTARRCWRRRRSRWRTSDAQAAQRAYTGRYGGTGGSNMGAVLGGIILGNILSGGGMGGGIGGGMGGGWSSTSYGGSGTGAVAAAASSATPASDPAPRASVSAHRHAAILQQFAHARAPLKATWRLREFASSPGSRFTYRERAIAVCPACRPQTRSLAG